MLFENTIIGGINLSCRMVRSATFEGMADENGYPSQELTHMYTDLAAGGIGVMITGMMACSLLEPHQPYQIRIDSDCYIPALQAITEDVHAQGGKIIAQLVLMGSGIMMPEGKNRIIVSPSGVPETMAGSKESHALTTAEIHRLIQDAAAAAKRAQAAGFDGVQFHAAHGYLASKFLTPYYNKRTDLYGGSLENRARFLLSAIKEIRETTEPDYPVWVKLNCDDFMKEDGFTFAESKQVMHWLAEAGVNAIEISGGNTSSLPRKGPIRAIRRTKEPMYFASYAAEAAHELGGAVDIGVVGGFRSAADMETCLASTDIAFISMCRPLIRQPDLPLIWKNGSTEPALCISCSRCFGIKNVSCIFNREETDS